MPTERRTTIRRRWAATQASPRRITPLIELDENAGVLWLRLARPEALNALSSEMTGALEDALDRVAASTATVLVVAARGRAFCAGNDLREMATLAPRDAESLAIRQARLMTRFSELAQVTIAAVDGEALGGGLMLAVAQDLRIASDRARFGLPEVTLGFNPAYGIARLLDIVAGGHARDLLLTGRTVRATDALRMGLVNRVVAPATLEASAQHWAEELTRLPAAGITGTKRILARFRSSAPGAEAAAYAAALDTGAARSRLRAFLDRSRRPPTK